MRFAGDTAAIHAAAVLQQIMQTYGLSVVEEPWRVEGLLRDLAAPAGSAVRLLVEVHKKGFPQQLRVEGGSALAGLVRSQIVDRLHNEYLFDREAARWAVDVWSAALAVGSVAQADALAGLAALEEGCRNTGDKVRLATELAIGHRGRLRTDWAHVTSLVAAATASAQANRPAAAEIETAHASLRRFQVAHARALDAADVAVSDLPRVRDEALTVLADARAAVRRADASGSRSRRAVERLADAEQAAAQLDALDRVSEQRTTAQHVLDFAKAAVLLAAEAPRTARRVDAALKSVVTDTAATAARVGSIGVRLSALRREFAAPCSSDLDGVEPAAQADLVAAENALGNARRLAEAREWEDADEQLFVARLALRRAEGHVRAVSQRLAVLRELRADPARPLTEARFALLDARRFVDQHLLGPVLRPVLAAQAERLDRAEHLLSGVHPDYWRYHREIRDIRDQIREIVNDARKLLSEQEK